MVENENHDKPLLSGIGEREVIRRLIAEYPSNLFIGPGDDCGAVELDEKLLLMTTDAKCDSTHFPDGFSPFDKGWSITASNLSDIAAMGGVPIGFLIAYGLPRNTPFQVLHDIQAGIDSCLAEYSTPFVGADTKENPTITLTGTAVGIVKKDEVLTRRGSRPGDIICVSGPLGGSGLGLRSMIERSGILEAEEKLRRPRPKIKEGRVLAMSHAVTSCIDISDGLSSSLHELMRASGNGFEIDSESIPMHKSLQVEPLANRLGIAIDSGDEYELLFTIRLDDLESLIETYDESIGESFHAIGRVVEKKGVFLVNGEERKPVPDQGYEHFRQATSH